VLEEGQQDDWFQSKLITAMCGVAAVVIAAFVIRELTCEVPAVNLRLFRDPVFLSGTLIGALMFALLMATMFLLPLFMQTLLGFTATDAGFALMPRVLVMMVATPIVGRIYNAVSPRLVIAAGVGFIALGAYDMSHFTLQTSRAGIIWALTTQGVGFSCLFVPLSTVALSAVPRHQMADATGLNALFRQVGGSVGLAIAATLLSRYAVQGRTALVAHVTASDPAAIERLRQMSAGMMSRGFDAQVARSMALRAVDGAIALQSQLIAFERVFLLAGIMFLLVLPLLVFLKTPEEAPAKREKVDVHLEM
jgi:DHA2 family multidrug resistance protein